MRILTYKIEATQEELDIIWMALRRYAAVLTNVDAPKQEVEKVRELYRQIEAMPDAEDV